MKGLFLGTCHVETCVLLSKGKIDSRKVRVEVSLEDQDIGRFRGEGDIRADQGVCCREDRAEGFFPLHRSDERKVWSGEAGEFQQAEIR